MLRFTKQKISVGVLCDILTSGGITMDKSKAYVPKKGDILERGILKSINLVEKDGDYSYLPNTQLRLVGLSLDRIEAEYVPKSEADRLKAFIDKDINHIRTLHEALNSVEADRKERDEKLIMKLTNSVCMLPECEAIMSIYIEERIRKVFAEVDKQ